MVAAPKPPVYIDKDDALSRLVERLVRQAAIAVDTESNPLYAYAERLCLVQISTDRRNYLIDPVAGVDLALLSPIFADPGIVKVFHDAEFDILMLRRVHPFEFSSLFDTRVAAAALGLSKLGLSAMLDDFFGVKLDKRFQRSDWGKRPLSDEQIEYASLDTHYLLPMAEELRAQLLEAGEPTVLEVASECRRLCAIHPEPKRFDPDEYGRIKGVEALDGRRRRVLRELYQMRHEIAERRDVPAFKILSNDMLLALARSSPMDADALDGVRAVSQKLTRRYGGAILETVRRADRMGPVDRPPRRRTEAEELGHKERDTYERLRKWRKRTAGARPTDSSLVLTRANMLQLATLRKKPRNTAELAATKLLEPWRVRLYGDELVAILNGR